MIATRRLFAAAIVSSATALTVGNVLAVLTATRLFATLRAEYGHDAGGEAAGAVFGGLLADWIAISWPLAAVAGLGAFALSWLAWREGFRFGPLATIFLALALLAAHGWGHYLVEHATWLRSELAATLDPERIAVLEADFDATHRASERVFGAETLVAGLLVLIHIFALARRGGACDR